jgi:hypothetical protein
LIGAAFVCRDTMALGGWRAWRRIAVFSISGVEMVRYSLLAGFVVVAVIAYTLLRLA